MVVGKTFSTISTSEIFNKVSEVQVLSTVFPDITSLPCVISSPLREDTHPSFSLYLDSNRHVRFKDFADSKVHGGLLDLLCAYWHCTFKQALDNICRLCFNDKDVIIKPKQIKSFTRREVNHLSKLQVVVRPWKDYDYEYWSSYGISKKWLKYAEIYPISYKIITKKESPTDKGKRYIFPADTYAYAYIERKDGRVSLKIYQPYNTKGFKWCSKMDASVISLWSKIPEYGDKVVICSSVKDALCLSAQLNIPTLALQGEGYSMSDTAINELKRRYKKVFICFDTDKAGLQDSQRLAQYTGFINVVPDLGSQKDLSDNYRALEDKQQFKQLEILFN